MNRFLLVVVIIISISSLLYSQNLNEGLILHYPFNGNANDESGNGNHGTVYEAAPTTDRFGNPNSAYAFDGIDDYIQKTAEDINRYFSISCWFYLDDENNYHVLYSERSNWRVDGTDGTKERILLLRQPEGELHAHKILFGIRTDAGYNNDYDRYWISTTSEFKKTGWYHIVAIRDDANLMIYVNNVLEETERIIIGPEENQNLYDLRNTYNDESRIGKNFTAVPNYSSGKIDDFRIYNRVLSTDEIDILYYENVIFSNNIELIEYELSPTDPIITPGDTFFALYKISNKESNYVGVNLDARFRNPTGGYGEFIPYTRSIIIKPGEHWYERECIVPEDAIPGEYDFAWWLLRGHDNGHITTSGYIKDALNIKEGYNGPFIKIFPEEILDFGDIPVNTTKEKIMVITNIGSEPLEVQSISMPTNSAFNFIDLPSLPFQINHNSSFNLHISFKALNNFDFDNILTVKSNSIENNEINIKLKGGGLDTGGPFLVIEAVEIYSLDDFLNKIPLTNGVECEIVAYVRNIGDSEFSNQNIAFQVELLDLPGIGNDLHRDDKVYPIEGFTFNQGTSIEVINPDLYKASFNPNRMKPVKMKFPVQLVSVHHPMEIYNGMFADKMVIKIFEEIDKKELKYFSQFEYDYSQGFTVLPNNDAWLNFNYMSNLGSKFAAIPVLGIAGKAKVLSDIYTYSRKWKIAKLKGDDFAARSYFRTVIGLVSWELFVSGVSQGMSQTQASQYLSKNILDQIFGSLEILNNLNEFKSAIDYFGYNLSDPYPFFKELFTTNNSHLLPGNNTVFIGFSGGGSGGRKSEIFKSNYLTNYQQYQNFVMFIDTMGLNSSFDLQNFTGDSIKVFATNSKLDGSVDFIDYGSIDQKPNSINTISLKNNMNDYEILVDFDGNGTIDSIFSSISIMQNELNPPNPVEISEANFDGQKVVLKWYASSSEDINLYVIYRNISPDPSFVITDSGATTVDTVFWDYNYKDNAFNYYWVTAMDVNSNESIKTDPIEVNVNVTSISSIMDLPNNFELKQNYPNPFNPTTIIEFILPKQEIVTLEVYNIIGQKISTLLNKPMKAGHHVVEFNPHNLSSGIYFYRIEAGEFHQVKKMIFLK